MAKSWKPKLPKKVQPYKPPKPFDTFKLPKAKKEEPMPHIITEYERQLIQKLCPVIKKKQLIRFWYDDKTTDFSGWRHVEPHLIGQTKYKHANIWLVGWFLPTSEQLLGGHEEKWGNYILNDISKLEIIDKRYRFVRHLYNRNDKRMTNIYCATD